MNPQTITASIVAATHRQNDADTIRALGEQIRRQQAEIERLVNVMVDKIEIIAALQAANFQLHKLFEGRVAALEAVQQQPKKRDAAKVVFDLMADGQARNWRDIAQSTGYTEDYISTVLHTLVRSGALSRIARGVYQRRSAQ